MESNYFEKIGGTEYVGPVVNESGTAVEDVPKRWYFATGEDIGGSEYVRVGDARNDPYGLDKDGFPNSRWVGAPAQWIRPVGQYRILNHQDATAALAVLASAKDYYTFSGSERDFEPLRDGQVIDAWRRTTPGEALGLPQFRDDSQARFVVCFRSTGRIVGDGGNAETLEQANQHAAEMNALAEERKSQERYTVKVFTKSARQ